MEPIKIKRGSWHYRLATFYGQANNELVEMNTCDYIRAMCRGVFVIAVLLFAFTLLVLYLGTHLVMWLYCAITINMFPPSGDAIVAMSIYTGVGGIVLAEISTRMYKRRKQQRESRIDVVEPQAPSPIQTIYDGWKNKYCVKIEVAE